VHHCPDASVLLVLRDVIELLHLTG
jgi:hypothetical protein